MSTPRRPFTIRRNLILIVVSLATAYTGPVACAQSVTLKPNWQPDQALTFKLTKTSERTTDDSKTDSSSTEMTFDIKVVAASAQGYQLELVYGETKLQSSQPASMLAQRLVDLAKGIRIVLNVEPNGVVKGVANWQDAKRGFTAAVQQISTEPPDAGMTEDELKKILSNVTKSISNKGQIEAVALRDIQMVFMCLGQTFEVDKPVVRPGRIPNPLGGKELPTLISFELVSTVPASGLATIHFKQGLSPGDARKVLDETMRSLERKAGKPIPEGESLKDMKISDAAAFKVEIDSGWLQSAKHGRVVRAASGYQKETTSIVRQSGP